MYKDGVPEIRPTLESIRSVIECNFDLLVHDLSCGCSAADAYRASCWLLAAEWTVADAMRAWHDWWLEGGSRA